MIFFLKTKHLQGILFLYVPTFVRLEWVIENSKQLDVETYDNFEGGRLQVRTSLHQQRELFLEMDHKRQALAPGIQVVSLCRNFLIVVLPKSILHLSTEVG